MGTLLPVNSLSKQTFAIMSMTASANPFVYPPPRAIQTNAITIDEPITEPCKWFKLNTLLRYTVNSIQTERHTLIKSSSQITITNMKYKVQVTGAKDKQTVVAVALVLKRASDSEGHLNLLTYEEVTDSTQVPLYNALSNVIDAGMWYLHGQNYKQDMIGGFLDSTYPGPITLYAGDEIQAVTAGSDNYVNPKDSSQGIKGYVTGTLTYQLLGPKNSGMPFSI